MNTQTLTKEIAARVEKIPYWFHSLTLAGVVTPGHKSAEQLASEWTNMRLPDLQGKTVLDIGAWDGFFSFEAERRGARRVVSLDRFVWAMVREKAHGYFAECVELGITPHLETSEAWDITNLPGKRGYDLAHEVLKSRAEPVVADYLTIDWQSIGAPFDVVFYLGVLYHEQEPLRALRKVAEATRELCVIETAGVSVPSSEDRSMWEFYRSNELENDITNWWAPNAKGLEALCLTAGFRRVEIVKSIAAPQRYQPHGLRSRVGLALRDLGSRPALPQPELVRGRLVAHTWK